MNSKQILSQQKNRLLNLSLVSLFTTLFFATTPSYLKTSAASQSKNVSAQPTIATVKNMVNGDLMCYVTLVDDKGIKYESVGATFEICEQPAAFLNKRVNLVYGLVRVNDCESAEPCGKTRQQTLITRMQVIANSTSKSNNCFQGASAGYLPPRLQVKKTGYSIHVGNLNIRKQPSLQSQIVGALAPGGKFTVVQGPSCSDSYVWWYVNTGKVQGWVAEGEPSSFVYWLAPNSTTQR